MSKNTVQNKPCSITENSNDGRGLTRNPKKGNSLSGLLAHYNSDSEVDESLETDKLDSKVDNFLQEINSIAPAESTPSSSTATKWQECYDESTGYPYYWNLQTNQVTWEMPEEYKNYLNNAASSKKTPVTTVENVTSNTKNISIEKNEGKVIEKLHEDEIIILKDDEKSNSKKDLTNTKMKKQSKKPTRMRKSSSESDEGKIELITSYSDASSESEVEIIEISNESETKTSITNIEDTTKKESSPSPKDENKKEIIECYKEDIDETIILARIRTQAKVLQELDGEVPESVNSLLNNIEKNEPTPSLSLVAGYGDDSENEDDHETAKKLTFPIPDNANSPTITTESTLFPITKPIDINQFAVPEEEKIIVKESAAVESVDTKLFKRKKRIGIAFDLLPSKPEKRAKGNEDLDEEHVGFGFKTESELNITESKYGNFKKGGIAFVKADVLQPSTENVKSDDGEGKKEDLKNIKEVVTEKVSFLCEGKCEVSAVQTMMIQLQTLEEAYKSGGLNEKYLYSWLRETDRDLAKLEKDAAPDGWLCQWDRSNKRYFYRNEVSGETQWNYPEQDIVGGQEAMDICTTPPPDNPPELEVPVKEPEPPPPPVICTRSPSPPPPPVITDECQPPLPPLPIILEATPPPPPPPSISVNQPLPPGVDQIEQPYLPIKIALNQKSRDQPKEKRDSFGSELDSFYSDIAKIEASSSNPNDVKVEEKPAEIEQPTEGVKKKKKTKSKLTQGSSMKKKQVSSLVEKWKKVQNDYM